MHYPKGTFWANFQAALKYKDDEMLLDLISDQITDIALAQPAALNAALAHAGIPVDKTNLDAKYLVGLVGDNLHTSKQLVKNLDLMIADMNTPHSAEGGRYMHDSQDNDSSVATTEDTSKSGLYNSAPSGGGVNAGQVISGIGSIAGALTGLIGTGGLSGMIGGKAKAAELTKQKLADSLTAKANAASATANANAAAATAAASSKTFMTIGVVVVIGIVILGAGYLLFKDDEDKMSFSPSLAGK